MQRIMKRSTKFWITLGLIILVAGLFSPFPFNIISGFMGFLFLLVYLQICIMELSDNGEIMLSNKYNIIYGINKFINNL